MSWIQKLFGRGKVSSSQIAKDRLKMVLIHDRSDITPGMLETIKDEIIATIGERLEVDRNGVAEKRNELLFARQVLLGGIHAQQEPAGRGDHNAENDTDAEAGGDEQADQAAKTQ